MSDLQVCFTAAVEIVLRYGADNQARVRLRLTSTSEEELNITAAASFAIAPATC